MEVGVDEAVARGDRKCCRCSCLSCAKVFCTVFTVAAAAAAC